MSSYCVGCRDGMVGDEEGKTYMLLPGVCISVKKVNKELRIVNQQNLEQ